MSNNIENDREQQPSQQPASPTSRGGGDVSGKGISDASGSSEGGGTADEGAGGAGETSGSGGA